MTISAKSTSFIFAIELLLLTLSSSSIYSYARNYISSPVIADFLFNTFFYFSLVVFIAVSSCISLSPREAENSFRLIYCTAICQAVSTVCVVFWLFCLCSEIFHLRRIGSTGPSGLVLSAVALAVSFVSTLLLYMISYVSAPEGVRISVFLSSPFCSCVSFLTMIFMLLGSGGWFHCSWTETGEHVLAILMMTALSITYGVVYFFAAESEPHANIGIRWMYLIIAALDMLCIAVSFFVSDATTLAAVVLVFLFISSTQVLRAFNIWNFIFLQVQDKMPVVAKETENEVDKTNPAQELAAVSHFPGATTRTVRFRQPSTVFGADFYKKH